MKPSAEHIEFSNTPKATSHKENGSPEDLNNREFRTKLGVVLASSESKPTIVEQNKPETETLVDNSAQQSADQQRVSRIIEDVKAQAKDTKWAMIKSVMKTRNLPRIFKELLSYKGKGITLAAWAAIIDTLIDPNIVNNTYANAGHILGSRIRNTARFFGNYLNPKDSMESTVTDVNNRHRDAGVVVENNDGFSEVREIYKDSFNYIAAALVNEMLRYLERLGLKKNEDPESDYQKVASMLVNVWYQLATAAVGGKEMPSTMEEHETFLQHHEASITAEQANDEDVQAKGREIAMNIIPWIAYSNGVTSQKFVSVFLRPEVAIALKLHDIEWKKYDQEAKQYYSLGNRYRRWRSSRKDNEANPGPRTLLQHAAMNTNDKMVRAAADIFDMREVVSPDMQRIEGKKGAEARLIEEDQEFSADDNAFIIVIPDEDSCIRVTKNGIVVSEDSKAEAFGEMSLLTKGNTTATVALEGSGHVLSLNGNDFQTLMQYAIFRKAVRVSKQARMRELRDASNNEEYIFAIQQLIDLYCSKEQQQHASEIEQKDLKQSILDSINNLEIPQDTAASLKAQLQ